MERIIFICMLLLCVLGLVNADANQKKYQTSGIIANLPVFYKKLAARQVYSLSWLQNQNLEYSIWQQKARSKVIERLLAPPPLVPFDPVTISEQDRGSYVAKKVVFNLTGDSRVLAFMLVPKSAGTHPAVLLLHDHGAKFDIGKEKVIEPWDEPDEKVESAKNWVKECYGGRFIGDELAKKGYVCLAVDRFTL